jgi:peptidoglycan/xylan/chitin deacetylase (PgdA/CDA1 family)
LPGWVGERYRPLIREIERRGHEIACHGYDHRLVYSMTPEQFREDVLVSKRILEDAVGKSVIGYRAPSYSITEKSLWALDILGEEGYRYDSSISPSIMTATGFRRHRGFLSWSCETGMA